MWKLYFGKRAASIRGDTHFDLVRLDFEHVLIAIEGIADVEGNATKVASAMDSPSCGMMMGMRSIFGS